MNSQQRIRKIAGVGILTALAVVLQFVANYITIGQVNINLSLIPIVISAIIYGPFSGALVGGVVGVIVLFAPSTGIFLGYNALATIILCIVKTALSGLVSGYLFKLLRKINLSLGIISSSIIVPIVNTLTFVIGVLIFFLPLYGEDTSSAVKTLISTVITINFLIEFLICAILSPTLVYLVKLLDKRFNLGIQINTEKE
ncbi:MAG: ECF transporter S component [Bacillales bacterium]|nr:ECF transporter S component [Bacillales bacterium]